MLFKLLNVMTRSIAYHKFMFFNELFPLVPQVKCRQQICPHDEVKLLIRIVFLQSVHQVISRDRLAILYLYVID